MVNKARDEKERREQRKQGGKQSGLFVKSGVLVEYQNRTNRQTKKP